MKMNAQLALAILAWFDAADGETARRIAEDLQRVVWDEAPFVPLGLLRQPMAFRRTLTGIVKGGPPLFWNVRRA